MNSYRSRLDVAVLSMLALAILGALFLFFVGIDALEGRSAFQFFADSTTYHAAASGALEGFEGQTGSLTVGANYVGPLFMLRVAGGNYYIVLLLNIVIFMFSIIAITNSLKLNALALLGVLLLNPLTFSSLLSVNKEIISVAVLAFLILSFVAKAPVIKVFWAMLAVVGSVLVRWELTIFIFTYFAISSFINPFRQKRMVSIILLLAGLSIGYYLMADFLEPIRAAFTLGAAEHEGSGLQEQLVLWQGQGAYLLVFPLKALHLLFGLGLRFDRLLAPVDIYNDVWQLLHSTAMLLLAIALWRAGRLRLANNLVYLSLVYIAIFTLTPIYSPRYFYFVYVIWSIVLVAPARADESGQSYQRP